MDFKNFDLRDGIINLLPRKLVAIYRIVLIGIGALATVYGTFRLVTNFASLLNHPQRLITEITFTAVGIILILIGYSSMKRYKENENPWLKNIVYVLSTIGFFFCYVSLFRNFFVSDQMYAEIRGDIIADFIGFFVGTFLIVWSVPTEGRKKK